MLRSMTACSKYIHSTPIARFSIELFSINRRHLEIYTQLPKELTSFDPELRRLIGSKITRGNVTLKLFVQYIDRLPIALVPNLPLARQIKQGWDAIAQELSIKEPFRLDLLAQQQDLFSTIEELPEIARIQADLMDAVTYGLSLLLEMKEKEGKSLQKDLEQRFIFLRSTMSKIATLSPNVTNKYRQKLLQRIHEVQQASTELDERILREVALFAEKVDISEEITRFLSHIDQCEERLRSTDSSVGKTLEFLLQELLREANTIGSKATDTDVIHLVVEIKAEIERIREQIQNVE